jgi:hypothetical protein
VLNAIVSDSILNSMRSPTHPFTARFVPDATTLLVASDADRWLSVACAHRPRGERLAASEANPVAGKGSAMWSSTPVRVQHTAVGHRGPQA